MHVSKTLHVVHNDCLLHHTARCSFFIIIMVRVGLESGLRLVISIQRSGVEAGVLISLNCPIFLCQVGH